MCDGAIEVIGSGRDPVAAVIVEGRIVRELNGAVQGVAGALQAERLRLRRRHVIGVGAGDRIHGWQVSERDEVAAGVRFLRQRGRDLRKGVGTGERVVAVAEQTAAEPALDLDVDGDRVGERAFEKCRHRLDRGLEAVGRAGDVGAVGEVEFHRACPSRSVIPPLDI